MLAKEEQRTLFTLMVPSFLTLSLASLEPNEFSLDGLLDRLHCVEKLAVSALNWQRVIGGVPWGLILVPVLNIFIGGTNDKLACTLSKSKVTPNWWK